MLNDIDFDYVEIELPNILWAKSKAKTYDKAPTIGDRISPLIYAAAKKFPKWKFVSISEPDYSGQYTLQLFGVYEGREKIGSLGAVNTRQGRKYAVQNERIRKTRQRGGAAETKDVKKALSLMAKFFGKQKVDEKITEAQRQLSGKLYNCFHAKVSEHNSHMNQLTNKLTDYIFANFEEVSAAAISAGAPASIDKLPSIKNERDIMQQTYDQFSQNKGRFVLLEGSSYIVRDGYTSETFVLSSEMLSEDIRLKLGMLKLVEDNHFVKDMGFRLNANTFFIMD